MERLPAVAAYIGVLAASADAADRAEDRSQYEARLASATSCSPRRAAVEFDDRGLGGARAARLRMGLLERARGRSRRTRFCDAERVLAVAQNSLDPATV